MRPARAPPIHVPVEPGALVLQIVAASPSSCDELDETLLRGLKACVRCCDTSLRTAVAAAETCLRASSSAKRLGGLLVLDFLFSRSKLARSLVVARLPELVASCTRPLPAPAASAERLETTLASCLQSWHCAWGAHYAQLSVALQRVGAQPAGDAESFRLQERALALDLQLFRAQLTLIEAAFARTREGLAAADRTVSLLASSIAPARDDTVGDDDVWVDVEPVAADEQLSRPAPCDGAGAFHEPLRAALADLTAVHGPELELAIAQIAGRGSVEGRGPLLAEGLQLRSALAVTQQRLRALLGEQTPEAPAAAAAPLASMPAHAHQPSAAREPARGQPAAQLRRARLEKAMARLRTPRGR